MAAKTDIAWCDSTANIWEGCTEVSKAETGGGGCDNCYAANMNRWLRRGDNWGPGAPRRPILTTPRIVAGWQRNAAKFRAKHGRNRRVFVNSISDWLDNEAPVELLVTLLDTVRLAPDVTFLLLSKRIGNWKARLLEAGRSLIGDPLRRELQDWIGGWLDGKPPANVFIGATVVNQREADRDIPKLLAVPARVRFLSIEPMLGPIDLTKTLPGRYGSAFGYWGFGVFERGIDWVIVGGESGRKARPLHPDWIRALRDQCLTAGVKFFFKQWGEWWEVDSDHREDDGTHRVIPVPGSSATERFDPKTDCLVAANGDVYRRLEDLPVDVPARHMTRLGTAAAGRQLDGREHSDFPNIDLERIAA
jgi:protein gp37